mmetsp:Transcript_9153/g.14511  ORF Transcript_9153/g.14511 Transcript_9153/m.14511 type:complete len:80 (-) Transcript_9153:1186-1425(-)
MTQLVPAHTRFPTEPKMRKTKLLQGRSLQDHCHVLRREQKCQQQGQQGLEYPSLTQLAAEHLKDLWTKWPAQVAAEDLA